MTVVFPLGERLPRVSTELSTGTRCAVHPVRPAVDRCPVCTRARCAADAARHAEAGCDACGGRRGRHAPAVPAPPVLERLVRGALGATGAALLGGVVAAQYVGAELFGYLAPFVVGVLTAAAAQSAAGGVRTGPVASRLRVVAAVYAVLGVGLGFALERSEDALAGGTLVPYACALAGVVLWTLPPKAAAPRSAPPEEPAP